MPKYPGGPKTEVRDLETLRSLLLEGAASPLEGPADHAWFEELREHARKHARSDQAGGGKEDS